MRRLPDLAAVRWRGLESVSPELVGAILAVLVALVVLAVLLGVVPPGAETGSASPSP